MALSLFSVLLLAASEQPAARSVASPLPRVPEGFTIEVAAGPELVQRPVMANFDEEGRLYVVASAGVNHRFNELVKDPPHEIVVLEDTDGDGRFDSQRLFADKLVMPQGVLPYQGAVYVASPPSVWKLEDTDGDGVCDRRTEIVTEFGSNGNAADIHGPFLGPDGWLYLCDGRHGHKVKLEDGSIHQGLAGGIFRFRTDGSGFEQVCGGGFDNPVEIDFTPEGEIVGTVNILHGNPRIDCLMHWVEGGVYPRADQEQCLAEFKRTGDLLPPLAEYGHVAVSGMTRYRSSQFGGDYPGSIFVTFFNRHQVIRSILEREGATFKSREEDFLVSDDPDFHPTDVLEDADGSLLVINTGGWFRIGCPQSQIAKPDVYGAIYRIRRRNAAPVNDPRGTALQLDRLTPGELTRHLDDPRPAVQERVIARLATLGEPARAALERVLRTPDRFSETARRNAVVALGRIADPAVSPLAVAVADPSDSVRQAAIRAAGMIGDPQDVPALARLVIEGAPPIRREAATALGRICAAGSKCPAEVSSVAVKSLFDSLRAGVSDRFLEHALLFAAIRIENRDAVLPSLQDTDPRLRRAALIVLDQMDGGNLTRELVTPLLETDDAPLQRAALDVISRHDGWAAVTLGLLKSWLGEAAPTPERLAMLRGLLLAQSTQPEIQQLISTALAESATVPPTRLLLWEVVHRAPLAELPAAWTAQLAVALDSSDEAIRREAVAIVNDRGLAQFDERLTRLVADNAQPMELRIAALGALAPRLDSLANERFDLLTSQLGADLPPLQQIAAARVLADVALSESQLLKLAGQLTESGPLATPVLLRAFASSEQESIGLALVAALKTSPAATSLAPDELAGLLRKYPPSVQESARELLERLGADLEKQQARLAELAGVLTGGDPLRGRSVFFSRKAACANCHVIAGQGTRIGPDLTKIGASRSPRDLLEAIVFPSASFVREFRPYTIVTTEGRPYSGIISRQTADALYLRAADLTETRLPREEIEEMAESSTSIMPNGLDRLLSESELRDLIAYLAGLK